ncbi:MAG: alpha-glucosidase [Flavobacterium sp.]|uniref:glycoside hydrolase family 13 protein n=1 Tax=Flavobacterium sp. TaxID=239 RepID=UPI0022CD0297|nr:alpha-glucosidase [Flavobacterium sp.]MCZ8197762.1 alpha-glucosidase [Flavobacterium sp.]
MANSQVVVSKNNTEIDKKWWKEAVIYQIYPRSFKDSNGDGIGDLQGIISKLDYLKSLGIDAIWLSPIYESPNDDNGYDISDYRNIMKDFGTMEDFDQLLKGMHDRGIKLVMDLVFNHSSDEHYWFQESKKSRDNKYRDYYYWWPAEKGTPPYRWSWFDVNSNAWKYDATTDSYYLHYFSKKQPDLNWNNAKVREELYDIMRFWLDKGVDGYRMDAFQFISKDPTFPELPKEIVGIPTEIIKYYGKGPKLHEYIQEMNREVLSNYPNVMSVSEGAGDSPEAALKFVDEDRKELNMAYHFESVDIGYNLKDFGLVKYKEIFSRYDETFKDKGWLSIFMANHDQPRMVSKFGNDTPEFREISSKMLSTFVMTMRGTSYYFQGDELGMSNIRFESIDDYNDVDTKNRYEFLKNNNGDLKAFLEDRKQTSRENGRTPFQWNSDKNAGFTTGKPWLKVNPNYTSINAEILEKDQNSTLNYFRKLVELRKKEPTLVYGTYTLLDKENPTVFAYQRELNGKKIVVLLNFSEKESMFTTDLNLKKAKVLLGNYKTPSCDGNLKPYESVILEIK